MNATKLESAGNDNGNPTFFVRFAYGVVASAIIMFAFANLQVITDATPEWIKTRFGLGAGGVPIAILTIGWIAVTCIRFVTQVSKGALTRYKHKPSPFVMGAFVGLCVGLFLIRGTIA